MTIEALCEKMIPPKQPLECGSEEEWHKIEKQLGTALPSDYKEYIRTFGTGKIGAFLLPFNPFAKNKYLNLVGQRKETLDALREFYDEAGYAFPLFPDPNGLLPWGVTDNGDLLFWQTRGEPDAWTVVVDESRGGSNEQYDETMTSFLAKLIAGELVSKIIPKKFISKRKLFEVLN